MKNIREMFNISYFDNKELGLKEHCDVYSNIRQELISILNKYDIKYVVADTELIRDLSKENQSLKKQLEDLFNENRTLRKKLENCMTFEDYNHTLSEKVKLKIQQKEFIEYLENMIIKEKEDLNTIIELMKLPKEDLEHNGAYKFFISFITKLEEILSKYKEIIGVSNEK